ncbi:hypothetical protein A9Q97_07165 [Rhodospirillales bacterium 47_12_T64]|nr:hypothetical protein A9Q97_07165 [Rhodospirillales bacterium 47_12_T64]
MEKQTFMVVEATPNPENMEDLKTYGSQSYAILEKHGGVRVANYNVESVLGSGLDSGEKPALIGVFSFPSPEAIQNLLFNDPDYQKLVPFRDKGFKSIRFFVCSE